MRLAIDGDDLVAAGLPGPAVGRALDAAMGGAGRRGSTATRSCVALRLRDVNCADGSVRRRAGAARICRSGPRIRTVRGAAPSDPPQCAVRSTHHNGPDGPPRPLPRARAAHRRRPARRHGRCSPPAAAACPRARSPRSTSAASPTTATPTSTPTASASPPRSACPRERFLYGRQVHGTNVRRATEPPGPARPAAEEDGQATALDDVAALVFTADCLPVMLVAEGAVAALHGGWRGLAGGILAEGVAALRELGAEGAVTAALGPAARGCCYEVGEEVHAHFAALRRAGRRAQPRPRGGRPRAARGRRRAADPRRRRCARCAPIPDAVLLPPPRRRRHGTPGGGRVAGLITGLEPEAVRADDRAGARGDRARRRRGAGRDPDEVELLAAVKYVALEELGVLAEAGLTLVGENRAQELEAKATAHPRAALALHRPAPEPQGQADPPVRRADPLRRVRLRAAPARDATARRRPRSSSRSTSPGRRARRASPRTSSAPSSSALPSASSGLMTMPPFSRGSRGQPAPFRRAARARRRARTAPPLDGHLAGLSRSPSRRARRSCVSARVLYDGHDAGNRA